MMSVIPVKIFFVAMSVAMASAAPVSSQEKAEAVGESGDAVDRAKRAQETIYFGNQQNKARVLAKKSDMSFLLANPPSGEEDEGSQVIAHAQVPVEEDLAAREEAALGKEREDEKMAEAVESAMQSAVDAVVNGNRDDGNENDEENDETPSEANNDVQPQEEEEEEEEEVVNEKNGENTADNEEESEMEEEEVEEDQGQATDGETGGENEDQEVNEDTAEKDLQEAAESSSADSSEEANSNEGEKEEAEEVSEEEEDGQTEGGNEDEDGDETSLQQLDDSEEDGDAYPYEALYQDPDSDEYPGNLQSPYTDPDRNMYDQLMLSPYQDSDLFQTIPYMYYRRRRRSSLGAGRQERSRRRIKRDLMDDNYLQYAADTGPWSDEDYEYVYKMLVSLLAEDYVKQLQEEEEEEQESPYVESIEEEQVPLRPEYLPEANDNEYALAAAAGAADDGLYVPEAIDLLSAYEQGYDPYASAVVPEDFGNEYRVESKRGMVDFYPEEVDKRYFFPFSDEPETHWGAFVPEKRDYGGAIQRLQRLALALGDDQWRWRDMGDEYKKK